MNSRDVLNAIEQARDRGDFDLVKELGKSALENPQSDIDPVLIMDQIAHMFLDACLIWVNEMKKIDENVDMHQLLRDKPNTLRYIADNLENPHLNLPCYTQFMREMAEASAEDVRNKFLNVDDKIEKAKAILKGEGL